MNGARKLALDYIMPRAVAGQSVLDLGAGASPLAGMMSAKGCHVTAVDRDSAALTKAWEESGKTYTLCVADVTQSFFWNDDRFDLVTAVYSIQHMLGHQARVWSQAARVLKPGGRMIFVGRFDRAAPRLEAGRKDPLVSDNLFTIEHMAGACGLVVTDCSVLQYQQESYREAVWDEANAVIAEMCKS